MTTKSNSEPTATKRWDDPGLLLPEFRSRVELLLNRLTAAGFEPVLFETYRSPERAAALAKRGTGIALSMHCLAAAADIICRRHKWDCGKNDCQFYEQLGKHAEHVGIYWGGLWKTRDLPHVQAIPVNKQAALRGANDQTARERIVAQSLRPVRPC